MAKLICKSVISCRGRLENLWASVLPHHCGLPLSILPTLCGEKWKLANVSAYKQQNGLYVMPT